MLQVRNGGIGTVRFLIFCGFNGVFAQQQQQQSWCLVKILADAEVCFGIHFVSAGDDDDVDGLLCTFMMMPCIGTCGSWEFATDSLSIKAMALRSSLLCIARAEACQNKAFSCVSWVKYYIIWPGHNKIFVNYSNDVIMAFTSCISILNQLQIRFL